MALNKQIHAVLILLSSIVLISCGGGGGGGLSSGHGSGADSSSTTSSSSTSSNSTTETVDIFTGTGSTSLSWVPPTTFIDGSSLNTLSGHNIYVDAGNGFVKIQTINNPSVSDYLVENLAVGSYTFAITAFDSDGVESAFSNTRDVTISI